MAATFDGPTPTTTTSAPSQAAAPQSPEKASPSKSTPAPETLPRSIEAWDSIIKGEVKDFLEISQQIGGPVAAQVRILGHSSEKTTCTDMCRCV